MSSYEILKQISSHQLTGVMTHHDMMLSYDFLGLRCFKRMHEYHMFSEMAEHDGINRYSINHLNKIIINDNLISYFDIPKGWESENRLNVNNSNRKSYLQNMMNKWHDWEIDTKKFYSLKYMELCAEGDLATAKKVMHLLKDVDKELKCLERWLIKLDEIEYDLKIIATFDKEVHDEYKDKTKEIGIDIC